MLVFLSGALVGAVGYRLYAVNSVGNVRQVKAARPSPDEVRKKQIEDARQKVHLDDQQVAQYNAILDNTRQQFDQLHDKLHDRMNTEARAIHDQQVAKVKAILRPDQLPLYEKWVAEREAERKKREQQRDRDANKK